MKQRTNLFFLLVCLLGLTFPAFAQVSFVQSIRKQELLQAGKVSFEKRCSGCHGMNGDGKGPAASFLGPRPRDFTKAIFKFKSTAIGDLPLESDLMRTINRGVIGTSMPSFSLVSEMEKKALIEYIKSFAPENWKKEANVKAVAQLIRPQNVFTDKKTFLQYAMRGRAWFQELGCVSCHGNSGKGDGTSASTLKDAWGYSIKPANLTKPYIKRGPSIDDVAQSIYMGVDGTPMPSHADILASIEDKFPEIKQKNFIWELAAWVFYFRGKAAGIYQNEIADIPSTGIPPEEVKQLIGQYLE